MVERGSLTPISEAEYEAIEAAVMETARGRWFLSEFARRNRTADTTTLLTAISRLEQAVTGERAGQSMDRLRFDLMEMAKAIARTKSEIAAIHSADQEQSRLTAASETLDAIVRTTERATSDILEAAEHVQEAAWTLREGGADEQLCGELDRRATEIYTACSFQDLTAQRTGKIVNTLRYLENRIDTMIDIWGADEPREPAPDHASQNAGPALSVDLTQTDVDTVIVDGEMFSPGEREPPRLLLGGAPPALIEIPDDLAFMDAAPSEPEPLKRSGPGLILIEHAQSEPILIEHTPPPELIVVEQAPPPVFSRLDAFADIENLDTREKLRRFT
jgi:chemotaxis regulatin CheY-phosphate phosphatase CheZ